MRLIIAGSRTFRCMQEGHDKNPDPECIECLNLAREIWRVLSKTYFLQNLPIEIVSGTARGADKLGELFAQLMNYPVKPFPAKWRVAGKVNLAAGFERNQEMAMYGDAGALFWDGESKGTQDMERKLKRARKPVVVYNFVTKEII